MNTDPIPLKQVGSPAPTPLERAMELTNRSGVVSLALGLPDPGLLPIDALATAAAKVFKTGSLALQYSPPCEDLRNRIVDIMRNRGLTCSPEQVILTHGAQQGLSLLARLLLTPGKSLIEEEISYPGFQHIVDTYSPVVSTICTDPVNGLDIDDLRRRLSQSPRASVTYVMPNAHNPMGVTIDIPKRRRIAQLAREHRVPVIEDDPYYDLFYDDRSRPPVASFDSDWVFYVGTFSKVLGPALRVGWIVAPRRFIGPLGTLKENADLNVSTFSQWVVSEFISQGTLERLTSLLRSSYKERCDAMCEALQKYMPGSVTWSHPSAGIFVWLRLPPHIDSSTLLEACVVNRGIAFLPGAAFSRKLLPSALRLNFSRHSAEVNRGAVQAIADMINATLTKGH